MIYIDDSIMRKNVPATAGSKILENFIAPFNATIITRLMNSDSACKFESIPLGEFGMGDPGELPGTPLLCNEIFGNIRQKAVQQGFCHIRPTYGTVSRFGLIPAASSMDQIGIVCKNPREGFSLLSVMAGYDENDGAMFPEKKYSYNENKDEVKIIDYKNEFDDVSGQVLQILAYAEICNNISRYDGIKSGYRAPNHSNLEELYLKTRTDGFGIQAKLASVTGCMILSNEYYEKYYDKAMKVRRLIKESLKFGKNEVLSISTDSPIAVLAGLPSLTCSYKGTGVQLVANVKQENALLKAWGNQ